MNPLDSIDNNEPTKQPIQLMTTPDDHQPHRHRVSWSNRECIICGSRAVGMNFGAPTCAPCKAFFRRNARRKEVLKSPCHHPDISLLKKKNMVITDKTIRYLQIRRCSSCRLRRCFEVGMKEESVRTEEENERHKKLVDTNRKRREMIKQQKPENQLSISQHIVNNNNSLTSVDWSHLSNIVYAYDTCCLKIYLDQRENMFLHITSPTVPTVEQYKAVPMNMTYSLSSFLRSLPAFQSISRSTQSFLMKNNLRRLMFLNIHELGQSCFSEPWQVAIYNTTWKHMCGPELYKDFAHTEELARTSMIADPIVTRIWIIILFFSAPLFSYYDSESSVLKVKKTSSIIDTQNAYATLLWKYLTHRHGYMESVRIYSNLMHVFLNMQRVGFGINNRLRTQKDLNSTHETLDQLVTLTINDTQ